MHKDQATLAVMSKEALIMRLIDHGLKVSLGFVLANMGVSMREIHG